jgi:hypothetical protein
LAGNLLEIVSVVFETAFKAKDNQLSSPHKQKPHQDKNE